MLLFRTEVNKENDEGLQRNDDGMQSDDESLQRSDENVRDRSGKSEYCVWKMSFMDSVCCPATLANMHPKKLQGTL